MKKHSKEIRGIRGNILFHSLKCEAFVHCLSFCGIADGLKFEGVYKSKHAILNAPSYGFNRVK